MINNIIEELISNYEDDKKDYTELCSLNKVYCEQLNKEYKDSELEKYVAQRNAIFEKLKKRALQSEELRTIIAKQSGLDYFAIDRSVLSKPSCDLLEKSIERLRKIISEVARLDKVVSEKLSIELDGVKVNLKRLQGALHVHDLYNTKPLREAKFIDKNR